MKEDLKILVALNPLKGTLSSEKANRAVSRAIKKLLPCAEIKTLAVSDGGDGFLDCLKREKATKILNKKVAGPLNKKVNAKYLMNGRTAYIEIAEACGIKYLKKEELAPLRATSYGAGELIKDALERGAGNVYLGLGGTASSDGGLGMAKALGFIFKNSRGSEIENSIRGLAELAGIENPAVKRLPKARFFAVTDVVNPLLGKNGSARIYGPQKGANRNEVLLIEKALKKISDGIERLNGRKISKFPGGAAAGGLGAGLYGFLNARILNGAKFIAEKLELEKAIKKADLVITGEGRLDDTTFAGKMPGLLCRLSAEKGKKTVFITGSNRLRGRKPPANCLVLELTGFFPEKRCLKAPAAAIAGTIAFNSEKIKNM